MNGTCKRATCAASTGPPDSAFLLRSPPTPTIMKIHLYLSLNPEALIASHLPPEEFGAYLAVGTQKFSRGQAMFFDVDPAIQSDYPPFQEIAARCLPHLDGSPRRSTYLAIYRVLEHVPVAA